VFKDILVPVDGSAPSDAAVKLAAKVAADEHAKVTFAHVVEIGKLAAMAAPSSLDPAFALDAARSAGEELLARAKASAASAHLKVTTILLEGDTVEALLDFTRSQTFDLIIVGSHGRGGISRAILGSVAEGILRRASIPVLVTHAPRSATKPN
jgi:nucleotide-binding universal stress UspA family protein